MSKQTKAYMIGASALLALGILGSTPVDDIRRRGLAAAFAGRAGEVFSGLLCL